MKYCPHCGSACEDSDLVCKNCGKLMSGSNPAPNGSDSENQNYSYTNNPSGQAGNSYQQGYYNNSGSYPPPYTGYPVRNNGFAVASLVLGIIGVISAMCCVGIVPAILALVFGCVSKNAIERSGGRESGSGMATSGIILGIIAIALFILVIVIRVFLGMAVGLASLGGMFNSSPFSSGNTFNT